MNKIEFKIIKGNERSEEINEILNEEDMESSIQIRYIKYPTLFDSLKLDGVKEPLIVPGIDTTNNKIVGLGACTIFEDNIAYLNSFRIRKEYRNKVNFGNGYKKIIEELEKEGIDTIITTILDDNKMAKEILTKQRRNMPIYEFYKNITFYSIKNIKKNQLFGIEEQSYMFTIATTNMILRGDGKSNLENKDFLSENPAKLQLKGCTVGMMNPPYSMGSKTNPALYEINFINHLLDSIVEDGRVAVIVPQSTFTGKTKEEKKIKEEILKNHTLEGVITLNKNTFYRIGTNPCIAIFTTHNPHSKNKMCKFINFENDGYIVSKHIGLIDDGSHKDKKQHLLDVWFGKNEAPTKFCVETTIEADDEWLHSFYYFNDEIPNEEDFKKTVADYLTFEVNMITHGRGYLFGLSDEETVEYTKENEKDELKVSESEEDYE